jgi:signal transduction histidine kinase
MPPSPASDALDAHARTQWQLRERVKELTCLYAIARAAGKSGACWDEILQSIAELLPPAWQFPEVTEARISADERVFETRGFRSKEPCQRAEVVLDGERRGAIEVVYLAPRPLADEGPFLKEERSLIDEVARQVALVLEHRQAEQERALLQDSLRQADRLATIGGLAAGAAHELNEPLGGILGFAQLALKHPGLPSAARRDLEKIERATLHAREVIRQLLLFARQTPPQKQRASLNEIVRGALGLIGPRSRRAEVELSTRLADRLPPVVADPAQLQQVVLNLVLNALQAVASKGHVLVETSPCEGGVALKVSDDGAGMTDEVVKKIFLPFYTTKEQGKGTGLGLSVVHGIVEAHGGSIAVESAPGRGSAFEVRLPLAAAQRR